MKQIKILSQKGVQYLTDKNQFSKTAWGVEFVGQEATSTQVNKYTLPWSAIDVVIESLG